MFAVDREYRRRLRKPPDRVVAELAERHRYEVDAVWPRLRSGYRPLRVTALRLETEPEAILAEVGVLLEAA